MYRTPGYMRWVSEALCEVMEEIGVNATLVLKRRRTRVLEEIIRTVAPFHLDTTTIFYFGSQSEGTTTLGLESDIDLLFAFHMPAIIQSISEWRHGYDNWMMIQNETIPPGYCYLQPIGHEQPVTDNDVHDTTKYAIDSSGRKLVKIREGTGTPHAELDHTRKYVRRHGAALTEPAGNGTCEVDNVVSFYCQSPPYQASSWLQNQRTCKWPTEAVLNVCRNAGCFVIPVRSKAHAPDRLESKMEWRISTGLQERYLMFSLNIPQIMCYIMMKMVLKTHINPYVEDVLSSYMCKNVLFYCIATSSHEWLSGSILSYLHLCLFILKECIRQRNCPHFIIPENNLLAERMTDTQRDTLLDIINILMKDHGRLLFEIQIDDLGKRVMTKLGMIPYSPDITSSTDICLQISNEMTNSLTERLNIYFIQILDLIKHASLNNAQRSLSKTCSALETYGKRGDIERIGCDLLTHRVSSTLGSVIACKDIDTQATISDEAFVYLESGKDSDALSGRLKLISVLYCTGDMERAERELRSIECQAQCNIPNALNTRCDCDINAKGYVKFEGSNPFNYDNEKAVLKFTVALCTKFLRCELNCVPHELKYEIIRSYIQDDIQNRTSTDSKWMDMIVVDAIPYLYFLQYKIYGHLQRRKAQLQALYNLALIIVTNPNFGHKETALNLLGQCLEQENRDTEAVNCYLQSIKHRRRNNAAVFLLGIKLFKQWKKARYELETLERIPELDRVELNITQAPTRNNVSRVLSTIFCCCRNARSTE